MDKKLDRPIARGAPAALTQRDVDRLARGEGDARLSKLLASQPIFKTERPQGAARARYAPIGVEPDELRLLIDADQMPARFLEELELVAQDPDRFGKFKSTQTQKAQPKDTPPD